MNERINELACHVVANYTKHHGTWVFTIALGGIGAAGKGFVAEHLSAILRQRGVNWL